MPQTKTVTDKGLTVDLEYHWDLDDGIKEGWIVHMIEAYAGTEPAGYIKVSYIPEERYRQRFATPFAYAVNESGSFLRTRYLLEEIPEAEWGADELRKAIEDSYHWLSSAEAADLRALDEPGLKSKWQARKRFINEEFAERQREFTGFHLDKPLVDHIRVYEAEDPHRYVHGTRGNCRGELHGWQRQGVGTVLYEAAAVWMAEHGLYLWASGLQSGEAELAWKRLAEKHRITKVPFGSGEHARTRLRLDGREISLAPSLPALESLDVAVATVAGDSSFGPDLD